MTKQFCDICGHIAAATVVTSVKYPELSWTGYKSGQAGSGCDGRWTPRIEAYAKFKAEDFKESTTPDLCVECQAKILQQMAAEILKGRG